MGHHTKQLRTTRGKRLGNVEKLVSDALQAGNAFLDDALLWRIVLERGGVEN
jgi:hypothetical protein